MIGSSTPSRRSRTATRRPALLRSAVALGLSGSLLMACGGTDSGAGGSGGAALQDVTFLNILPLASLSFTPELVADTCGHFEKQGLNVTFETTKGSAPAIQTVIAGSALVTRIGDIETMIAAGGKDAPLLNIGTVTKQGPIRIVSSTRAPIKSAEDFRGKLIGLPSEGGTSEQTVDLILGSADIPPSAVDRQVVGLAPGVFDLVQSGRIDGYVVSLDTAVLLQQQQPDAVVFNPSDAIDSGAQLYATSQAQAQDPAKQEQLRRYLAAIDSAIKFVIEDEANGFAKTLECISSEYDVPALDNPEVAKESLSGYVDSWTVAGADKIAQTIPEQWESTYQELVDAGLVERGLKPGEWYTNEFSPGTD